MRRVRAEILFLDSERADGSAAFFERRVVNWRISERVHPGRGDLA